MTAHDFSRLSEDLNPDQQVFQEKSLYLISSRGFRPCPKKTNQHARNLPFGVLCTSGGRTSERTLLRYSKI
jgi:hypothetical protein